MTQFHIEIRKQGRAGSAWQRVRTCDHTELADDFREQRPEPGAARRKVRADREKPLPAKLAHSIKPSRETGATNGLQIGTMARLMAEHIKRKGLTDIRVFPETASCWKAAGRASVPQSVREFNAALWLALSEEYTTPEGWKRGRLPERYRVSVVDPREWIGDTLPETELEQAA